MRGRLARTTVPALLLAIGERAGVRPRCGFVAGRWPVPERDVAVARGCHPTTTRRIRARRCCSWKWRALRCRSDRISTARIYAAARVPESWIVNLRDGVVEVLSEPDPAAARDRARRSAQPGENLEPSALPGASVAVSALLPGR